MRKEVILKYGIYLTAIVFSIIFVVTKNEALMDAATDGMYRDGDVYRFTKVKRFKAALPPTECEEGAVPDIDPDSVSLFVIGDSFMETCRGHKTFPAMLEEQLHTGVYPVFANESPKYFDPNYFFWKNNIDPDKKKTVILERVERYVIFSYSNARSEDTATFGQLAMEDERSTWEIAKERWFTEAEKNYEIFFSSSDYVAPIVELWNTFCFDVFGMISDETPIYSLHPPFLFYKEEVSPEMSSSFYFPHPDSLVKTIADNISALKETLRVRYNAELIFMPIPNAYTLYHSFINTDRYDGFVPRLCTQLEQRGVRTVQLYSSFTNSKDVLYFPTDSHWNAKGTELGVKQTLEVLAQVHSQ